MLKMNREKIFSYIEEHQADHIAHIQRWVRQKSVSWDIERSQKAD